MNEQLDISTLDGWMQKIMERFDRTEQLICALSGKEFKEVHYLDGERLLDNQDACQMLHASKRSMQRHRSDGTLNYHMVKGKVYYKESDIENFIRYHFDDFEKSKRANKKRK